jgi:hypothetical protein
LRGFPISLPTPVLLAAAVLACGYAVVQFGRALLAQRWPTVDGEIIDGRVVYRAQGQNRELLDWVVTYRYEVAGRRYTNNRVRFGQLAPHSIIPVRNTSSNRALQAAGLTRSKRVRVHYNPRRPEDSVLYRTPDFRVWILLAAGLYFGFSALHRIR